MDEPPLECACGHLMEAHGWERGDDGIVRYRYRCINPGCPHGFDKKDRWESAGLPDS